MAVPKKIGRYEIREVLGQGGMGVVYRAMDTGNMNREVALKTIRDVPDRTALTLFQKEIAVLAPLSHPNIVEIYDIDEYQENGERRPFFVMPLLSGQTLDHLIRNSSHRLTVERAMEIFTQTCRGLHAAHERGLVHRDLKPSNIFVLNDDSVKIIDFGVAHMVDTRSSRGHKGTLLYMSPEQLEMKPVSAASDIFSLGVVCYEALTQRRPFERSTEPEVIEAILHQVPPLASELNPSVSTLTSRVINKAIAKQPWQRFSTAREFSETLQKAHRDEPIEIFDPARIQPRIDRAKRAFDQGDYEFAGEILTELEAEGHADPEMAQLRRRTSQAITQRRIRQLLESARTRFDEGEDPLALQKVEEALELERGNVEALTLKAKIESRRGERQIESWLKLAYQHIANKAYGHARQALQNVLQIRPQEGRALQLLAEVNRAEQEYLKLRQEKERLYQAAQDAWHGGDISTALGQMGQVIALDDRVPDTPSPGRAAAYRSFYNQIRLEHDEITNAYAEARKHLADQNFEKTFALSDQYLSKYPNHALFKALKFDAEAQQRLALAAYIADVDRRVEAEPDLDKRISILREALTAYPGEPHFERSLKLTQDRHELVGSIVTRARLYEEQNQFIEALGQWEILRTVYERYPGLAFEIERVKKRRDQRSRSQAKARWVEQIDCRLSVGDYGECLDLLRQAQTEFPNDGELTEIEKLIHQGMERGGQAQQLLAQGQELHAQGQYDEALDLLRKAHQMDERNSSIRSAFLERLAEHARRLIDSDWRAADRLSQEALSLDPRHPVTKSVRVLVEDLQREEAIDELVTEVRRSQGSGDLRGALACVERGLSLYPKEDRLRQLRETIKNELSRTVRGQSRQRDLEELQRLDQQAELAADPRATRAICEPALELASQYDDDREIQSLAAKFRRRLETAPPDPGGVPPRSPRTPRLAPAADEASASVASVASEPSPAAATPLQESPPIIDTSQAETAEHRAKWTLLLKLAGAVLLVVSLFAVIMIIRHRRPRAPIVAPQPEVEVTIDTHPAGATVRIDNQDYGPSPVHRKLNVGAHQLQIVKQGYQPVDQPLDVREGAPAPRFTLSPLPLKVQVLTGELPGLKVQWDDQPSGDIQGSSWEYAIGDLKPHKLVVSGSHVKAQVSFDFTAGAMPTLSDPLDTNNIDVAIVSSFGGLAHLEFSPPPAKVTVDDQEYEWKVEGVDLSNLTDGNHTLSWHDGGTPRQMQFETGSGPELAILLFRETGAVASAPRRTPPPAPHPPAPPDSQAQQIYELQNQAHDAYLKGQWDNAIEYSNRVLQLNPGDDYVKQNIQSRARDQERMQITKALADGDLSDASRMADNLTKLMPDDADVKALESQVNDAIKADAAKYRPPPEKAWSRPVTFDNHSAAPTAGSLTVLNHDLQFLAGGDTSHQPLLNIPCSEISEIKENGHFHKKGFRVLTKSKRAYEFLSSDTTVEDVKSACKK
jgi:serine/threonine-protein kinase